MRWPAGSSGHAFDAVLDVLTEHTVTQIPITPEDLPGYSGQDQDRRRHAGDRHSHVVHPARDVEGAIHKPNDHLARRTAVRNVMAALVSAG